MRILSALTVLLCFAALPATAQQSAADCADLEEDRERLECYDRFFSQGGASESRTQSRERGREASRRTSTTRGDVDDSDYDDNRDYRHDDFDNRRTARREMSPEDRFGRDTSMLDMGGEEMSSTALGNFRYWREGQRIELENGQVWEITNDTNLFFKANNPRVKIEKGFFSSFYMHIDGVSQSLRVRRVR